MLPILLIDLQIFSLVQVFVLGTKVDANDSINRTLARPEIADMSLSILNPMNVPKLIAKEKNLKDAHRSRNHLNPSTIQ